MIIQTFYPIGENESFLNEGVRTSKKMIKELKLHSFVTQLPIQPTTLVVNYFTVHQQKDEQELLDIQNVQQQEVNQQNLEHNGEEQQLHLSLTFEHHPIDSDDDYNWKCYQDPNSPPSNPKSPSQNKQVQEEISQDQFEEKEQEESQAGEMTLSQQIEANNFQEFLNNHQEPEPIDPYSPVKEKKEENNQADEQKEENNQNSTLLHFMLYTTIKVSLINLHYVYKKDDNVKN
ncbi:hypothetical protein DICPUDRAFT_83059 [Dictyostelium purpureum]|uniref:Uncharacterized protein n=1 Tax=Dictyostelium purpureum TaxID=5786 RepID=F0ZYF0_DICPU|nr:uncharacterized protein DICPUDRAFT_83059 [Dictyostelium purpureum]EGC31032.1 hypothetical protein DICPUDRAFT_83059 [Dictyostelium purpureum]|eukprot:XP_003292443.1 hypothetical protein DICPUDRAFT_83059 [Dictyostelium purpureum]